MNYADNERFKFFAAIAKGLQYDMKQTAHFILGVAEKTDGICPGIGRRNNSLLFFNSTTGKLGFRL